MLLENFVKNYEKWKVHDKVKEIQKISVHLENNGDEMSNIMTDRLAMALTSLLEGSNSLIHPSAAKLATFCLANYRHKMHRSLSTNLFMAVYRRLGDQKKVVQDIVAECLGPLSHLVCNSTLLSTITQDTAASRNHIFVENSLMYLDSVISAESGVCATEMAKLCQKLLGHPNFKVRRVAEGVLPKYVKFQSSKGQLKPKTFTKAPTVTRQRKTDQDGHSSGLRFSKADPGAKSMPHSRRQSLERPKEKSKPVKFGPRTMSLPKETAEAGITTDDLKAGWEEQIRTNAMSIHATMPELDQIKQSLTRPNADWTIRVKHMKKLRGIVNKFAALEPEKLAVALGDMFDAFYRTIKDPRSKIHREVFVTLSFMMNRMRDRSANLFVSLMPFILSIFTSSSLPSVSAASSCLELVFEDCRSHALITTLHKNIKTSRSVPIRRKCISCLIIVVKKWESRKISPVQDCLEEAISLTLVDPDLDVRIIAAQCFWEYIIQYQQQAIRLYSSLESRTRVMVVDRCPSSDLLHKLEPQLVTQPNPAAKGDEVAGQNGRNQHENTNNSGTKNASGLPRPLSIPKPFSIINSTLNDESSETFCSPHASLVKVADDKCTATPTETFQSPTKTLFGPPGFTPFSTKHGHPKRSADDIDVEQIKEIIVEVEFESIFKDLDSGILSDTIVGLDKLLEMLNRKKKISLSNIIKLQEMFLVVLGNASMIVIQKCLECLNVFLLSYNFNIEYWVYDLVKYLLNITLLSAGFVVSEKIVVILRTLQTLIDEQMLVVSVMRYMSSIAANIDTEAKTVLSSVLKPIFKTIGTINHNQYYAPCLTRLIVWSLDHSSPEAVSICSEIIQDLHRIDSSVFTRVVDQLGISEKESVLQLINNCSPGSNGSNKDTVGIFLGCNVTKRRPRNTPNSPGSSSEPILDADAQVCLLEVDNCSLESLRRFANNMQRVSHSSSSNQKLIGLMIESTNNYSDELKLVILQILQYLLQTHHGFATDSDQSVLILCLVLYFIHKDDLICSDLAKFIKQFINRVTLRTFLVLCCQIFQLKDKSKHVPLLRLLIHALPIDGDLEYHQREITGLISELKEILKNGTCTAQKYCLQCFLIINRHTRHNLLSELIQDLPDNKRRLLQYHIEKQRP